MREIRFRGKRTDNGEWVYGWYIRAKYHWHNRGIHEDWIICQATQNGGWFALGTKYPVMPETVGQFTGLYDKNGTPIYEGDVVFCRSGETYLGISEYEAEFAVVFGFTQEMWEMLQCDTVEVIGNIHDKAGDE